MCFTEPTKGHCHCHKKRPSPGLVYFSHHISSNSIFSFIFNDDLIFGKDSKNNEIISFILVGSLYIQMSLSNGRKKKNEKKMQKLFSQIC